MVLLNCLSLLLTHNDFFKGAPQKKLKRSHINSISSVDDDGESVESEENLSGYYSKAPGGGLQPQHWQPGEHIESGLWFSLKIPSFESRTK